MTPASEPVRPASSLLPLAVPEAAPPASPTPGRAQENPLETAEAPVLTTAVPANFITHKGQQYPASATECGDGRR